MQDEMLSHVLPSTAAIPCANNVEEQCTLCLLFHQNEVADRSYNIKEYSQAIIKHSQRLLVLENTLSFTKCVDDEKKTKSSKLTEMIELILFELVVVFLTSLIEMRRREEEKKKNSCILKRKERCVRSLDIQLVTDHNRISSPFLCSLFSSLLHSIQ